MVTVYRRNMSKQNPTNLAGGQRRAQFSMGSNPGDEIELKNVSLEPRIDDAPVEIDRTRAEKRMAPQGDRLFVQRREPEKISTGGWIIPDKGQARPPEATLINAAAAEQRWKASYHTIF